MYNSLTDMIPADTKEIFKNAFEKLDCKKYALNKLIRKTYILCCAFLLTNLFKSLFIQRKSNGDFFVVDRKSGELIGSIVYRINEDIHCSVILKFCDEDFRKQLINMYEVFYEKHKLHLRMLFVK